MKRKTKTIARKKKRGFFVKLILVFFILFFITVGGTAIWISTLTIPSVEEILRLNVAQSTKIFDRHGELLFNIYGSERRTVVSIDNISQHLINATIAVEDKDFFSHQGIKVTSIMKAAWENLQARRHVRGGSTITQQVIKNTILTREKTYTRKIKEAILAVKLEQIWSKNEILELYLNETTYGGIIYGIEEASQYYFGIPALELNIAQSAYLAAMPKAPAIYSPRGKNRDRLDARKNLILKLMLRQGHINAEEYQKAKNEVVEFVFKSEYTGIKAPHFVMYVIAELKRNFSKEKLRTGGLRVHTTLDLKLQEDLQEITKIKAFQNEEKYQASNAAVVVLESRTGHILAMVGSRDYFDKEIGGKFNVATARRQPGSAFKSIIYLLALKKGYTPNTIVWDVSTEFSFNCNHDGTTKRDDAICYRPQNFDNKYVGPIKLKYALPESRNIPAVKFLYLVGIQEALNMARLLGITSLDKDAAHYGLNLVLGGGEVTLLNLTSVYSVFSNNGLRVAPTAISRIKNIEGKILQESLVNKIRVADEEAVLQLNRILSTNEYKHNTFGWNSPLFYTNRQVASKTGTTDEHRDAWTIGYDPSVTVGVWIGNNNNQSMKPSRSAHFLWRAAMDRVLRDYPNINFKEPQDIDYSGLKPVLRGIWQGNKIIKMDTKNKILATENTPEEFIKEIIIPEFRNILHWVNRADPLGPVPQVDERDDLYENWEAGVQEWVSENREIMSEEAAKLLEFLLQLRPSEPDPEASEPL